MGLSQVCSAAKAAAAQSPLCCAGRDTRLAWVQECMWEVHHGGLISAVGGEVDTPQACSIRQEVADESMWSAVHNNGWWPCDGSAVLGSDAPAS